MKIDTKQILKDFEGKELKDNTGKLVLLRSVLINALTYETKDRPLTAEQKIKAYRLGGEIATKDEVDIKAEEIVQILKGAEKTYGALIYGQLFEILNND